MLTITLAAFSCFFFFLAPGWRQVLRLRTESGAYLTLGYSHLAFQPFEVWAFGYMAADELAQDASPAVSSRIASLSRFCSTDHTKFSNYWMN
ncbi:hypothetical protein BJX63DRAFT_214328 [Aspergillus granulosus]|uniref:Uncharacterized protein n=1 Tax=Aspergillus granulosus TaxID=176169 RepID=A0ABR4HE27_9EURO